MHRVDQDPATVSKSMRTTGAGSVPSGIGPNPAASGAARQARAALGPSAVPISAAENPVAVPVDAPAAARGRRILSTAFVMVGPDGHLSVELHDGRALTLRDVVMHRKGYCGVQLLGGRSGAPYCGGYADVTAARPGHGPDRAEPDLGSVDKLPGPPSD